MTHDKAPQAWVFLRLGGFLIREIVKSGGALFFNVKEIGLAIQIIRNGQKAASLRASLVAR